jgi:hypothetical protein
MIVCPECSSDEVSGGNHGYQGWCCVECGHEWPMAGSLEIVTEPDDLVLITFARSDAVMLISRRAMMVMPANNAKMLVGYLAGKYQGRLGWLMSPGGWREPHDWLPYAFDNGAFTVFSNGLQWSDETFYAHLQRAVGQTHKPMWVAVPDVVGDREATLQSWLDHHERVSKYGVPKAFVVQDGMTPDDVPGDADVIFVGGSTEWKWRSLKTWTANHPRVHVGRVNTERLLWMAHEAGAESCDGTGWFRGDKAQLAGLLRYLEDSTTGRPQLELL